MSKLLIRLSVIPALPLVAYLLYLLIVGHYDPNYPYPSYQPVASITLSAFPAYLSDSQQHMITYPVNLLVNGKFLIAFNLILALAGIISLVFSSSELDKKGLFLCKLFLFCGYFAVMVGLVLEYILFFVISPIHFNDVVFYLFSLCLIIWPVTAGYFAFNIINKAVNFDKSVIWLLRLSIVPCIPSVVYLMYSSGHVMAQPLVGIFVRLIPLALAIAGVAGLVFASLDHTDHSKKKLMVGKVLLLCGYCGIIAGLIIVISLLISDPVHTNLIAFYLLNLFLLAWPVTSGYVALKQINGLLQKPPSSRITDRNGYPISTDAQ